MNILESIVFIPRRHPMCVYACTCMRTHTHLTPLYHCPGSSSERYRQKRLRTLISQGRNHTQCSESSDFSGSSHSGTKSQQSTLTTKLRGRRRLPQAVCLSHTWDCRNQCFSYNQQLPSRPLGVRG